jgi:phosphoglycerol transferase MdoB-like AlkP superfamily enzyme
MPALVAIAAIIASVLQWSVTGHFQPPFFGVRPVAMVINICLALAPLSLLALGLGVRRGVIIAIFTTALLALVNHLKIRELNEPLMLSNLSDWHKLQISPLMMRYAAEFAPFLAMLLLAMALLWKRGTFAAAAAATPASPSPLAPLRLRRRRQLAVLLLAPAFALIVCLEGLGKIQWIKPQVAYRAWEPLAMAADHGFLLFQALQSRFQNVHRPGSYSEARVKQALAPYWKPTENREPSFTPPSSVVLILLESFKDYPRNPTQPDPIPHYHRLRSEGLHGTFISPVFGGGTANAEFEIFTGLRTAFLPSGSVPYVQYVPHLQDQKFPSWVWRLARRGYETVAIHNNDASFWSRDRVYPLLGFQAFIDAATLGGGEASDPGIDAPVFAKSLELLRAKQEGTGTHEGPQFQFLITIGTHGPYPEGLKTYQERISRLDERLGEYFAELKKLPNPPVVVMFGDHQPSIGKLVPGNDTDEVAHEVEAVVWNARGSYRNNLTSSIKHDLACLAPVLMEVSDAPMTPYFRFVSDFCRRHPHITAAEAAAAGHLVPPEVRDYRVMSYDRLFGERFSVVR